MQALRFGVLQGMTRQRRESHSLGKVQEGQHLLPVRCRVENERLREAKTQGNRSPGKVVRVHF